MVPHRQSRILLILVAIPITLNRHIFQPWKGSLSVIVKKWNIEPVKTYHVHHHLIGGEYNAEQCDKAHQCAEDAKRRKERNDV